MPANQLRALPNSRSAVIYADNGALNTQKIAIVLKNALNAAVLENPLARLEEAPRDLANYGNHAFKSC
ncbi:MAG: hypothetical protein WBN23_06000 [Woeseia sp.]